MSVLLNLFAATGMQSLITRLTLSLAMCAGCFINSAVANTDDNAGDAIKAELIAENLIAPIDIVMVSADSERRLILDQAGLVYWLFEDNTVGKTPLLDIRSRLLPLEEGFEERGLLGFAVHPDFTANGRVFVTYTAPATDTAPGNWNYTRYVSEFSLSDASAEQIDINSERVLLEQHWPSRKHNGGALAFGPDGYLYIGFGDGGGIHGVGPKVLNDAFSVPANRLYWDKQAQDIYSLYGKILRIDVDRGYPSYAIPEDNPFAATLGRGEIYAWGFRNPYRIAFDPSGDGSFYVTAVAETLWEAVYRVSGPGNYGWPLREGTHCFDRQTPLDPPATCDDVAAPTTDWEIQFPVVEYANMSVHREGSQVGIPGVGTAVVGALMLRNSELKSLNGKLLIGDWSLDFQKPSGQLFAATPGSDDNDSQLWPMSKISVLETRIVSLAQDNMGRVYLLTNDNFGPYGQTGRVYQLKDTR